ncbi:MAG: hypothetical protein CVT66_11400 [Actinobacteria bacterium HGW-Actinobacteria-6]|jgi:ABC-type transport system involved in multi-copper enzyme maturation permease subunit|nr:MAG: hypothetical protein CVT66_11400 [Actinobacteria bacterium HGW-Actinobacteria-6]
MMRALAAEFSKLKRSRMVLWTVLVILGYTSIGLAVFPVIKDSIGSMAGGASSPVGDAFAAAGMTEISWETAMRFIAMGVSGAWGIMLLSLITAYVFGRELREGTDIASATLPISRGSFVVAKMVVIAVWSVGLGLLAVAAQVGVDAIYLGLEGFAWKYVLQAVADSLLALAPIYLTLPVVAWLSLSRKGYLRPMLFALVMFTISTSLVGLDAAAYFPWSMPVAAVGVTWMPLASELPPVSWLIATALFAIGLIAVLRKVNRAEIAA